MVNENKLNDAEVDLHSQKENDQNPTLKSLSPKNNMDIKHYKKFLDDIFKLEDVFNVGVTGPYGSGKSSTIESYKIKNPDKKFIHITLGKYDSDYNNVEEEPSKQELRRSTKEIEGKIINQLLHQVETKQVPQAFAKVKKNNSNDTILTWSFLVPITLILIGYIIMYNSWVDFVTTNGLFPSHSITINPMTRVAAAMILLVFVGLLTYKFGEAQINRTIIRKISFRGNEIELFKNDKNSFFDEHLNEVVYLFENSGADVIVFEDLDRYNNPDVFRKLRELNQLINRRFSENLAKQDSKKKLVFLYLIKDDIFVSKDRAKFFDLIIPIVPVVTSTNSYNKILDIFKYEILEEKDNNNTLSKNDKLSKSFLRKISLYIDDMRLIMNIYNEYKIYNDTINTADLSADKLLAIITYKNVFPRDFSHLQYGKGFLYMLINKKDVLLSLKKNEINSKIEILKGRVTELEKEKVTSIQELQMIYLKTDNILTDNKSESDFNSRSEYIKEVLKGNNLSKKIYVKDRYNNGFNEITNSITLENILEGLDNNEEYLIRKEKFEEKNNGELENLCNSIKKLNLEQNQVMITPISELFRESIFQEKLNSEEYKDIKNNEYYKLLSFLLRESFIDETYNNYMNYFYNNDLRKEDTIFLRELYVGNSMLPSYKLSNILSIIDILEQKDYARKGILNNNLFEYLLDNKYIEELKSMIFVASQENNINFILDLYANLKNSNKFEEQSTIKLWIEALCMAWTDFFSKMIQHLKDTEPDNITSQQLLIFDALCYLDTEQLHVQNRDKKLTLYLAENSKILRYVNKDNWNIIKIKLTQNIERLQTEFLSFDRLDLYYGIVDTIIDKNFYKLNYQNIEEIAIYKDIISENSDLKSFKEKNLTYIMKSDVEALKSRISENTNSYLEIYLKFSNGVIYDSSKIMIQVLNNDTVEDKIPYLEATNHKIDNIEDIIDQSLWINLLESDSIQVNIWNILRYYFQSSKNWEPELIEFVNRSQQRIKVSFDEVMEIFEPMNFFDNTVKLNGLNDDQYEEIIGKSGYKLEDLKLVPTTLGDNKIQILIDNLVIPMSTANLNYLRTHYPHLSAHFAIQYFEEYVNLINNNFSEKEVIDLLISKIGISKKEELLSRIDSTKKISIEKFEPTSKILFNIIDEHLKGTEISVLFQKFSEYSLKIQEKIIEISKINIELIKSNDCDKKLVMEVLKSDLNVIIKQQLFKIKISMMNYDDILSLIPVINLSESYRDLREGRWPKFEKTETNVAIVDHLEKTGVISSQGLEEGLIIARGRKK